MKCNLRTDVNLIDAYHSSAIGSSLAFNRFISEPIHFVLGLIYDFFRNSI